MAYICEWLEGGTRQVEWPTEELALQEAARLTASGVRWVTCWEMDNEPTTPRMGSRALGSAANDAQGHSEENA